jgi:cholesterol oxidase
VAYRRSSAWLFKPEQRVRARNVIFSAGGLGTLRLLFRCRDLTGSLSRISRCLGDIVRTNNEALLGACTRTREKDYSKGVAITSIFHADPVTTVEPVRYPAGSSLMRFLTGPLVEEQGSVMGRLLRTIFQIMIHPVDFLRTHLLPGWAQRTTILLVMQTVDTRIRLRPGRSIFTFFRRDLVSQPDDERSIPGKIDIGHQLTYRFAEKSRASRRAPSTRACSTSP